MVKQDAVKVQLYSIHSNPFNSNEFCVGGRSRYVKVYDRRKVSRPLYKLCPSHMVRYVANFSLFLQFFIDVYMYVALFIHRREIVSRT